MGNVGGCSGIDKYSWSSSTSVFVDDAGWRRDDEEIISDSIELEFVEGDVRPFSFCWLVFINLRRGVSTSNVDASSDAGRFGV